MPVRPACTPQSNITVLPLYFSTMQERPTSQPAPTFKELYQEELLSIGLPLLKFYLFS